MMENVPKFSEKEKDHYDNHAHKKLKFKTPEDEYREYSSKNKKICSKCKVEKYLCEFNGNTSGADPFDKFGYRLRRPECLVCTKQAAQGKNEAKRKAKELKIPYKAPPNTKCALCGEFARKGDELVFDHCHKTNQFRGYLHNSCNRSLGVLGDNVESLIKAINFINAHEKLTITQDENYNLRIVS